MDSQLEAALKDISDALDRYRERAHAAEDRAERAVAERDRLQRLYSIAIRAGGRLLDRVVTAQGVASAKVPPCNDCVMEGNCPPWCPVPRERRSWSNSMSGNRRRDAHG